MDIKKAIIKEFDTFVDDTFKKDHIKQFLKNHERKHIMVDKLKAQIEDSAKVLLSNSRPMEEKRAIIRAVARDFANTFCRTALDVKEAEFVNNIKTIGEANAEKEDGETIKTY